MPSPTTLVSMISATSLGCTPRIEDALGPQDHDGPLLAEAVAAGLDDGSPCRSGRARPAPSSTAFRQGHTAGGVAGGAGADADLGLGVVGQVGVLVGRRSSAARSCGAGLAARRWRHSCATSCLRSLRTSLRASSGPMRPKVSSLPRRTTGASAQAPTQLTVCSVKRPSGVVSPDRDLQFLTERLQHERRAGHVAGGAHAHVDDVLAHRAESELAVEAGHPVDPREGQVHLVGDGSRGPRGAGSRRPPGWRATLRRDRNPSGCRRSRGRTASCRSSGTKAAGFSPMTQADAAPQLSPGSVESAAARAASISKGCSGNSDRYSISMQSTGQVRSHRVQA